MAAVLTLSQAAGNQFSNIKLIDTPAVKQLENKTVKHWNTETVFVQCTVNKIALINTTVFFRSVAHNNVLWNGWGMVTMLLSDGRRRRSGWMGLYLSAVNNCSLSACSQWAVIVTCDVVRQKQPAATSSVKPATAGAGAMDVWQRHCVDVPRQGSNCGQLIFWCPLLPYEYAMVESEDHCILEMFLMFLHLLRLCLMYEGSGIDVHLFRLFVRRQSSLTWSLSRKFQILKIQHGGRLSFLGIFPVNRLTG